MNKFFLSIFTKRKRYDWSYLLSLVVSVALAFIVGAIIMILTKHNPLDGYTALINGAFGTPRAFGDTLARSVTLCLTGLAMAVAAKAGMFNVGGEGQLFLGAMAAAIIGATCKGIPPVLAISLALLSAMAAGGLYAFIPAILKTKLKVNEVITTIMLNSVAIYFCSYLANGPLKTADQGIAAGTDAIYPAFRFEKLVPLSNLTQSVFIAAVIALFIWYLMKKTTHGYEMTLTGNNERFARYMGIKTEKTAIMAMIISGALCGIVGMFEVYGLQGRFIEGISKEFYFDGMLVAMIMRYDPIGIIFMSVFFGALKMGSMGMELKVGIPSEIVLIVQSVIIFFMAAQNGITDELRQHAARRKATRALMDNTGKEGDVA